MVRALLAASVILVSASPLAAASYSAKPVTPTLQRFIAPDISWMCSADTCKGSTAESRPIVLCESLAKRAGRLDAFLVNGRAFTTPELAKCNAAARAEASKALASQ